MDSDHPQPPEEPQGISSSFFPPPPAHLYSRYTTRNLNALLRQKERQTGSANDIKGKGTSEEEEPLNDEQEAGKGVDFDLTELEPPNPEWIVRDGAWNVFGEVWPVEDRIRTLESMNIQQLFPSDPRLDRSEALKSLLNTVLHSYLDLIGLVLRGPPSIRTAEDGGGPSAIQQNLDHIRTVCINMHQLLNELRPAQARETLKLLMRSQIEIRRLKKAEIQETCSRLRSRLADLKTKQADLLKETVSNSNAPALLAPPGPSLEDSSPQISRAQQSWRRKLDAVDALM